MAEMGRPSVEFDWKRLDACLQYGATLKDSASIMECSDRTIERRIREKYDCTFVEYRDQKMATTRLTLVQKAINMANNGNATMLIFCLKNMCKWQDKIEQNVNNSGPIDIKLVKDDAS